MISDFVSYDADSGDVVWLKSPTGSVSAGRLAGSLHANNGYLRTKISGEYYFNHHIAMILSGKDYEYVDHINGVRTDNRLCNLRSCTHTENMRNRRVNSNSKTGITGVTTHPCGKYHAYIRVSGVRVNLGYYKDIWDAICARMSANKKYGFHENHGVKV